MSKVPEGTEDVMRKTKNINMSERKSPEVTSRRVQIRSLNTDSGRLKIKSIKKISLKFVLKIMAGSVLEPVDLQPSSTQVGKFKLHYQF